MVKNVETGIISPILISFFSLCFMSPMFWSSQGPKHWVFSVLILSDVAPPGSNNWGSQGQSLLVLNAKEVLRHLIYIKIFPNIFVHVSNAQSNICNSSHNVIFQNISVIPLQVLVLKKKKNLWIWSAHIIKHIVLVIKQEVRHECFCFHGSYILGRERRLKSDTIIDQVVISAMTETKAGLRRLRE